jgi:hypothetical protein
VTKVSVLFLVPPLLWAAMRISRGRWLGLAAGAAGFAIVLLLEASFWAVKTGNPLRRFDIMFGAATALGTGRVFTRQSLWEFPIKMFLIISDDGLFYYLLVPALLWALWRARDRSAVLLAWIFVFFSIMQFGSSSLSSYRPFPHNPRYLMPLLPAAAAVAGAWLACVRGRLAVVAAILFAIYAVPSVSLAFVQPAQMHTPVAAAQIAAQIVSRQLPSDANVYSDPFFGHVIRYFGRNRDVQLPRLQDWIDRDLKPIAGMKTLEGQYVIRFDGTMQRVIANREEGEFDIDRLYADIEGSSTKQTIPVSYGRLRRRVMRGMCHAIDALPLPKGPKARMIRALARHTCEPVIIIYHVGKHESQRDPPSRSVRTCAPSAPRPGVGQSHRWSPRLAAALLPHQPAAPDRPVEGSIRRTVRPRDRKGRSGQGLGLTLAVQPSAAKDCR